MRLSCEGGKAKFSKSGKYLCVSVQWALRFSCGSDKHKLIEITQICDQRSTERGKKEY